MMVVEVMNIAEVTSSGEQTSLVFDTLKRDVGAVYEILCPRQVQKTSEQVLADDSIPERIKDIVRQTCSRFYKYEIWSAEDYSVKDPVIIGREQSDDENHKKESWYDKLYLLGRWGEELRPFSELFKHAVEIRSKEFKVRALKAKALINMYLEDIPLFIEENIKKGNNGFPEIDRGY